MNPQHAEFMLLSGRRYSSMAQRFGKLPFTRKTFREFLVNMLGGEQGLTRCEYCNCPLDMAWLQLDHRLPPYSQGGSLGLENLAPCCEPCNQQKGQMSSPAFMGLLMLVNNHPMLAKLGFPKFSEVDRNDVLSRLQSQIKLAALEQAHRARALRVGKITVVRHQRSA